MDQQAAKAFILAELHVGLPGLRTYHSLEHTLDVYATTITMAEEEGINGEDFILLKTAALFHDAGFLVSPGEHEAGGCQLARQHLPRFGYSEEQVGKVCAMIMSTKIPQRAHDHLSEILCDADLDYLGRDDFFVVGDRLYEEMRTYGSLSTRKEWNQLQEKFISNHAYYTATSRAIREPKKQQHLEWVRKWLADNP